ncbi:MAG TPA: hypothetical protein VF756_11650 [Thermoanaerobaculia bacterium]
MTAVGSILVQPQRLHRTQRGDPDFLLVQEAIQLAVRLAGDAGSGGEIAGVVAGSMEVVIARLRARAEAGMQSALQRLRDWIKPLSDALTALGPEPPDGAADGLELGQRLLLAMADALGGLTLDGVRLQVDLVLDVLRTDLGVTNAFLEELLWEYVDEAARRLEAAPPGADARVREDRLRLAALLRRLKRRLHGRFTLPEWDADDIARALLELLRDSGLDKAARTAACLSAGLADGVAVGTTLTRLIPLGGAAEPVLDALPFAAAAPLPQADESGGGSGAASGQKPEYLWYASWLLGGHDGAGRTILAPLPLPWMPDSYADVWIDREQGNLVMKATLFGGGEERLIDPATEQAYLPVEDWKNLPIFDRSTPPYYTFDCAGKEAMESWAYHTAWAADALRMVLNVTSVEEGDWLANVLNAILHAGQGTFKLAAGSPFGWWFPVAVSRDARVPRWLLSRFPLGTLAGSFQGMNSAPFGNAFWNWFTLLVTDGGESYLLNGTSDTVRDAILSFLTLLNYEGPTRHEPFPDDRPDDRAENRKEIGGVAGIFGTIAGQILVAVARSEAKKDYCHPFRQGGHSARMLLGWTLLGGSLAAWSGAIVGTIVAECVAWAEDWGVLGKRLYASMPAAILSFYPSLYLAEEGQTDGGTFNPGGPAFAGYPEDVSNSPYSLPYEKDKSVECAEGNQGFWNHNAVPDEADDPDFTPLTYAYDFALDDGDEILAARSGTVVDFVDELPDNEGSDRDFSVSSRDWNFVLIRHDLDDAGNLGAGDTPVAPLPAYDRDQGGAAVTTYAFYGHGRQGSVRELLGNQPIGRRVRRGQPVMRCGNSGFYTHMHMDVRPGPAAPSPAPQPAATVPVPLASLEKRTLPFVFRDVSGRIDINQLKFKPTAGVPVTLNYYTSSTERVA